MSEKTELLRVEFHKDAMRVAKKANPLDFIVSELGAIVERMPSSLMADVHTAQKITVTFTTE